MLRTYISLNLDCSSTYITQTNMANLTSNEILELLLALFLPPLAVFLKRGIKADFWINLGLTLLGWIPGVVHAWYVIIKHRREPHV
ncbi:hypothetical protein K7432_009310 [Basidiobolus ranarum]|uniref:Uncharacterized protein n=1 Tax=Basidiobolus ranarum TaxID=34480 RepID=A0ABR2WQK2_9FUNG